MERIDTMFRIHQFLIVAAAFAFVASANAAIIGFEAESGMLGSNFVELSTISGSSGTYLDTTVSVGGGSPGSADGVATYSVSLAAGTYDLYARFYINNSASDDSFFAPVGFGTKDLTDAHWYHVNQLEQSKNSFTDPDGAPITNATWVWLNLTDTDTNLGSGTENVGSYTSTGGAQTFQYGHREDGLLIDAFAFVTDGESPSVAELDNALIPEPASLALLGVGSLLIAGRRRAV